MTSRPLSPHLQVYRLPLAAITSITHRATGVALTLGAFVFVAYLWAAAFSPACFAWWQGVFKSPLGAIGLFGWSFAFFYHLCAGIRHLVWDAGFGFEKAQVGVANWVVILGACALTAAAWIIFLYSSFSSTGFAP